MYHAELRQFPHTACRFNLGEQELHALLGLWVRGEQLELGERRWSPHQAKLTVIEGPRLEMGQLTMGRGWRTAERQGTDVTARVLGEAASAAQAVGAGASHAVGELAGAAQAADHPGPARAAVPPDPLSLGVQLAGLLGEDPAGLLDAWRAVVAARPELSPSASLAKAEDELRASRPAPR